ncbi:MAG: alpha/beta hydrolase [Emcibacteraceae bacterium]|nr:alpha/beta hydrolase [Emcibacteraceae bacterium]
MNLLKSLLSFTLVSTTPVFADSFKTSDGVIIDYEVTGEGAPLVLLHSGMMSREDMRGQIDYFSKFFMVIAPDSREQGRSSSSDTQISYELMAGDVIGLLDHLNVDKASFFGQSDGGITALILSHSYPQRVNKLAIHGAVYNKDAYPASQREGWENITWDENADGAKDPAGFPGMAISHYLLGQSDLSAFEGHIQEMAHMWATSPNLSKADVSNIQTPTLVIVGDHWDISIAHTVEMHETLPNSELFIAPGATHFIHQEKPDLLHKVLHDFLMQ